MPTPEKTPIPVPCPSPVSESIMTAAKNAENSQSTSNITSCKDCAKNDCEAFAKKVDDIYKNTIGQGKSIQDFMDELATTFTEWGSASKLSVGWSAIISLWGVGENAVGMTVNDKFSKKFGQFGSEGFGKDYYEPPPGNNQVRHSVGGLIDGYIEGEKDAMERMQRREKPEDLKHGVPDINLNKQTVPKGAELAGENGEEAAKNLSNWIKETLCK